MVLRRRGEATEPRADRRSRLGRLPRRGRRAVERPAADTAAEDPRSSSRRPGRPPSRSWPSTPTAATQVHIASMGRWAVRSRPRTTSGGRRPTSAGSSATLHRLRAAHRWARRPSPTRARSTIPAPEVVWQIIEREERHRDLHVADGGPAPDALRRERTQRHRPSSVRADVLRRRGPQRPGLGVAPEDRVRGPRAGHRPHVADRDGRPDLRQPVRPRACCPIKPGSAGLPLPGHRGRRRRRRTASQLGVGEKGIDADQAALPRADRHPVGRARALRRRTTGSGSRAATTSATPRTSTRTGTSGSPAAPTRSSRSPPIASARSRSRPRSCAIPPSPRRASPACPTTCAAR